jgi:hypothetical protein
MPYKDKNSVEAKLSRQKRSKKYYEKNRNEILIKNKTCPKYLKRLRLNTWKRRGVVGDLDHLYELWINTTNCQHCSYLFTDTKKKLVSLEKYYVVIVIIGILGVNNNM